MVFTYKYTGDVRLADFAEEYLNYLCKNDIFNISYPIMLSDEYHYNSNHTAGMGIQLRLPALVYEVTGKKEYLDASINAIKKVREKSVQLTGSPMTKLPEDWSWFNVYPEYKEADVDDPHEQIGLRKKQISWNIAFDKNISLGDIKIEEMPKMVIYGKIL